MTPVPFCQPMLITGVRSPLEARRGILPHDHLYPTLHKAPTNSRLHSIVLLLLSPHAPASPSPTLVHCGLKEGAITQFCNLILRSLFQVGLQEQGQPRGRLTQKLRLFRCLSRIDLSVS